MQLFIVPVCALIFTQVIKGILHGLNDKFSWRDFFSPGGMPSSHSALIVSLAALIGYYDGFGGAAFAIAVVLVILVIWDAGVLRQIIGGHARAINSLIHSLPASMNVKRDFLEERVGHKFLEILWGIIIGLAVSSVYILFLA